MKSDIGKYIFDVVQGYLAGKHDYPKWVLIPTDLHTPEDAAKMLQRQHGGCLIIGSGPRRWAGNAPPAKK